MNKCLYCKKPVKNKFCNVSCQNRYYNPRRKVKIVRNKKQCLTCEKQISLSNYERHIKVCKEKKNRFILNEEWKVNENECKCPHCDKIYPRKGIMTHIWLMHTTKGAEYKKNRNYAKSFDWKKDKIKLEIAVKKFKKIHNDRLKSGETKPSFLGKHHTKKTKEFLSWNQSRILEEVGNSGFKNIKWYKVSNIIGEEFIVRGTYELRVAEYLNKNKIYWKRKIYIKYKSDDGVIRTYTPDFYIPKDDFYIETKGYYSELNKRKMELINEQNNIDIVMIFKKDLNNLDNIILRRQALVG